MLAVEAPIPDTILFAERRGDTGALYVRLRNRHVSAGIGEFGAGGWTFHSMPRKRRTEPPQALLRDAVLLEASSGDEAETAKLASGLNAHPFWKEFVEAVQDSWPVADVMLG